MVQAKMVQQKVPKDTSTFTIISISERGFRSNGATYKITDTISKNETKKKEKRKHIEE